MTLASPAEGRVDGQAFNAPGPSREMAKTELSARELESLKTLGYVEDTPAAELPSGSDTFFLGQGQKAPEAMVQVVDPKGASPVVTGTGPNSGDFRADRLNFDLADVARIHGVIAWITLATLVTLAVRLQREGIAPTRLQVPIVVAVLQGALGYTQYNLGVPPELVMLHVIGSVAFFLAVLRMHLGWFGRPLEHAGPEDRTKELVGG